MTIYISQNGQKSGPYSLAEAQNLVATGAVQATDWAWYEGLTTWIPLQQVPGFASAAPFPPAAPPVPIPRAERPVLVWVICLLFFICMPFSFISIAMMPMMASGAIPVQEAQRHFFENLTYFDYGIQILNIIIVLTWAVLLFMLKRASLYVFLGSLGLGIIMIIYNIIEKDWLAAVGVFGLLGAGFAWVINLLLLYYNWHLFKKGVLR